MENTENENYEIINLDLWIKDVATSDDWERYEALLITFGNYLFQNNIGEWGGRETAIGKTPDGLVRCNYWFVLKKETDKSALELKRMVKNFQLESVTEIKIKFDKSGKIDFKTNFKAKFEDKKSNDWSCYR